MTVEAAEGRDAFLEKGRPDWSGGFLGITSARTPLAPFQ